MVSTREARELAGLYEAQPRFAWLDEDRPARLSEIGDFEGVPLHILDVPETIHELGYATHQFFRYYGKFPSVVGGEIVRRYSEPGLRVLDCYSGCGTTLVEAQLLGHSSFGIDLNPLGVFASNVKTIYYDATRLTESLSEWKSRYASLRATSVALPNDSRQLQKWFALDTAEALARIRRAILEMAPTESRDFLLLAFFAILRRTSRAFDGEIRPHVNRDKKQRDPYVAYNLKIADMLRGLTELGAIRPAGIECRAVLGDNKSVAAYKGIDTVPFDLVVGHPPYLNSFNYLQTYGLELAWAEDVPQLWGSWTHADIRKAEHLAWPATTAAVMDRYYDDLVAALLLACNHLRPGGALAVVIGDATIRGKLEPVHRVLWSRLCEASLEPTEVWYRTTHYGIGKYAYRHRADYHGQAEKRDAVLHFRKPLSFQSGGPESPGEASAFPLPAK